MPSMALKTTTLLLTLNLVFFSLVSSDTLPTSPDASCPDGIKFGACAGVLSSLLNGITIGTPPTLPCCGLFFGLLDLEAATCFCKAIKTNVLGVNLDASLSLNLLFNNCGKEVPAGFQC